MSSLRDRLFETTHVGVDDYYADWLEDQRSRDLITRQKPGIVFYPAAWLLISTIILLTESTLEKASLVITWGAIILGASLLRYIATRRYKTEIAEGRNDLTASYISLAISSGSWGIMTALATLETPLKEYSVLILMANFALCSGGIISLCISRNMTIIFLCGMMFPLFITVLFFNSSIDPGFSLLIGFYSLGMFGVSVLPKKEYEMMVVSNLKLSEQTDQLTELSTQDGLTGIKNRRYFDKALSTEISRASRLNYPLHLLIADIDHFKNINDKFGHLIGDAYLVKTAQILGINILRKTDILARYGGEEFAVILVGIEEQDAIEYAEQLRAAVEHAKFEGISNSETLTISVGGTSITPAKDTKPETIIEAADKALYRSKNAGRNRVSWMSL